MIIITGSIVVRPGQREQAIALGVAHSARSRGEPGCLGHECHVDAENPLRITFVEHWQDMDAVRAHFAVPASAAFVRELAALADAPPQMDLFEAAPIPRP